MVQQNELHLARPPSIPPYKEGRNMDWLPALYNYGVQTSFGKFQRALHWPPWPPNSGGKWPETMDFFSGFGEMAQDFGFLPPFLWPFGLELGGWGG